jgi:MGT family glycosyltransferase
MARLLVAVTAVPGHALPLLMAVRHLVDRGHEVVVHTGSLFRARAEEAGACFVPFCPEIDHDYRRLDDHFPERCKIAPGPAQIAFALRHFFADAIPHQAAGIRDILGWFAADAIIIDAMMCGAFPLLLGPRDKRLPILSIGVSPLAVSSVDTSPFGTALPPPSSPEDRIRNAALNRYLHDTVFGPVQQYFDEILTRTGSPALPISLFDSMVGLPDLYLQPTTQAFEYPRSDLPDNVRFVGPMVPLPTRDFVPPPWWNDLNAPRPVVVVTQGTVQNTDLRQLLGPTLTALAQEDVTVVATTGGAPLSAIPVPLPANARATTFLPFDHLLPKAAAFVTNGGYGAVSHALSCGVPLVVAGESEEKPEVAARVAWKGVGINLGTGRPSTLQIRTAVRATLTNPRYRRNAYALRDDFARHNALGRIAELVEEIVGATREQRPAEWAEFLA